MQLRAVKHIRLLSPVCVGLLLLLLQACSPSYPGLPNLPEKDWLAPEKSTPKEQGEKFAIYSPEKTLTMDDLVWLAIQQSPIISKGKINLEISEISKTDAKWRYLPEMHLSYHITNNLTKYNEGTRYAGRNYGQTTYELTFTGSYTNPITTFLNVKAQDELLQTAIITQRKAISEVIFRIASSLLRVNMLEESIEVLEKQITLARKRLESSSIRGTLSNSAAQSATANESSLAGLELYLQEMKMELTVERSTLKQLVGLDLKQALKVDSKSVYELLAAFDPEKDDWKSCWERTEDCYLARQQIKLERANVYLAWASYLPRVGLGVNESPGKGQSQSANAKADQFLHIGLDFPLLDWGHRWRTADMASLRARQRRLDQIQKEREYEQEWEIKDQRLQLARAKEARWRQAAKSAADSTEVMQITFEKGGASFEMLAEQVQRELDAEMAAVRAKGETASTKLAWVHFASGLSNHYMGPAGYGDVK